MIVIRFLRTGKKNQPFFRIVVTDKKNPTRGGRFLEIVGFFNPFSKENQLKADRIKYWISVGAQPSGRVHNLLVSEGVINADKVPVHAKAKKKKEGEDKKEEGASFPAKATADKPDDKPADKPADEKKEGELAKPAVVEKPAESEAKPKEKPEVKSEAVEPKKEEKPKKEVAPEPKPKLEAKPKEEVKPETKADTKT